MFLLVLKAHLHHHLGGLVAFREAELLPCGVLHLMHIPYIVGPDAEAHRNENCEYRLVSSNGDSKSMYD